ncbi:MAG: cystathionine beta-lyase [Rickettsiales bacterium]|jgi:cystathionine beta-lyase
MHKNAHPDTKLVHLARDPKKQGQMVNPPIYQASTIVFSSLKELRVAEDSYDDSDGSKSHILKYGRYGTQTNLSLEEAIAGLENADCCFITSCGASAINIALLAFLEQGDHLLLVDNAYSPTRIFADKFLKKFGVETTYFDPNIGEDIEKLIQKNTKAILLESPGSLSFELQDVDAICRIAKKHDVKTVMDNSWGSGIYYKALDHGVDVSVMALTKYINGHSDTMMGSIAFNKQYFPEISSSFQIMAAGAAPFSAYMVQRGLRTAKLRLDHSFKSALEIAKWLEKQPEIERVFYPALESDPSYALWKRDFTGAAGLFSIVLDKKYSDEQVARMVDNLEYFSMGYSWGGYESLILPFNAKGSRSATKWQYGDKTCFRINIGLEDAFDLKADLESGLKRLQ